MEDVTPLRRPDDRGQLILVTGLAIAVVLVALVLLLNTVIYTENLATRGADVGGRDAVEFRNAALSGVGGVVVTENAADHGTAEAARENVSEGVGRYADLLERGYLERATVAELSNLSVAEGVTLRHENETRTFTSAGDAENWTLATTVGESELRRFRVDAARDPLASSSSQSFRVVLNDGDDVWRVFVYREGEDIVVAADAGGTPTKACSVTGDRATLDLTDESLAGDACSFDFAEGIDDPYSVEYRYGGAVNGTYSLVVNTSGGANVADANFAPGPDSSPYASAAVYSATFDLHYRTPRLTYAERLRVAPGESE